MYWPLDQVHVASGRVTTTGTATRSATTTGPETHTPAPTTTGPETHTPAPTQAATYTPAPTTTGPENHMPAPTQAATYTSAPTTTGPEINRPAPTQAVTYMPSPTTTGPEIHTPTPTQAVTYTPAPTTTGPGINTQTPTTTGPETHTSAPTEAATYTPAPTTTCLATSPASAPPTLSEIVDKWGTHHLSLVPGSIVAVAYQSMWYVGEVEVVRGKEVLVQYYKRLKNGTFKINPKDRQWTDSNFVFVENLFINKITKGHFSVQSEQLHVCNELFAKYCEKYF